MENLKENMLNAAIQNFYEDKQKVDEFKKSVDYYSKEIKDLMKELSIKEFKTDDGLTAKITIRHKDSFNENALINKLKLLGITSPIKMIETIDYDALENSIYNNEFDAREIMDCRESKEIESLTVKNK